jgi:REP element-mobilizing transposase RayT
MNHYQSLNHTAWDCKYDLVWILKYRKKVLFGDLRKYPGDVFREDDASTALIFVNNNQIYCHIPAKRQQEPAGYSKKKIKE